MKVVLTFHRKFAEPVTFEQEVEGDMPAGAGLRLLAKFCDWLDENHYPTVSVHVPPLPNRVTQSKRRGI